jgi:hypothetical protein
MKRTLIFVFALASFVSWAAPSYSDDGSEDGQGKEGREGEAGKEGRDHRPLKLLGFQTMYGVDGPFLGDANKIRGVEGDEAPWVIRSARGSLDTTGHLRIQVRGLVFADDLLVDPELVGKNDADEFRGLVSCLTEKGDAVDTKNVLTKGFPATETGDSTIDAHLELPNPCVAPIVFVLPGDEDKWFAVTGFESEEEKE